MIFTPKNSILTYCSSNREEVAQFQLLVGHYRFALRFQGIGSLVNLVEPLRLFKNLHKVLKFEYSHFGSLKQDVLKDLQFDLAVKYFFGHKYMCYGYQKKPISGIQIVKPVNNSEQSLLREQSANLFK